MAVTQFMPYNCSEIEAVNPDGDILIIVPLPYITALGTVSYKVGVGLLDCDICIVNNHISTTNAATNIGYMIAIRLILIFCCIQQSE